MTIENDVAQVRKKLDMISQYNNMVVSSNFEPDTVADMKSKAKDVCDAIRSEVNNIKSEISHWG